MRVSFLKKAIILFQTLSGETFDSQPRTPGDSKVKGTRSPLSSMSILVPAIPIDAFIALTHRSLIPFHRPSQYNF